jgi:mycothiol synthase
MRRTLASDARAPIGADVVRDPRTIAERDGVVVRELVDTEQLDQAVALLDGAEEAAGLPLVDESERHRLERLLAGATERDERWRSVLAWRDGRAVGYGAVVVDGAASGDVAVDPRADAGGQAALRALLAATLDLARGQGVGRLQVWTRRAGEAEIEAAAAEGFEVQRRLAVMERSLEADLPDAPGTDAVVRSYRPGTDDEAVTAVLAAAYADTDEAGWDLGRFWERTSLPWFRAEDLLVAELPADPRAPRIAGLHWLKRRDATMGEVYNLAVHPAAQGHGLGPVLLLAGLAHLREVGCDDVLLWVDLANDRAVRLYERVGFRVRWQDLALGARAEASGPRAGA